MGNNPEPSRRDSWPLNIVTGAFASGMLGSSDPEESKNAERHDLIIIEVIRPSVISCGRRLCTIYTHFCKNDI